jgi:hypothetical protein
VLDFCGIIRAAGLGSARLKVTRKPRFHTKGLTGVCTNIDAIEPLAAEISRLESRARVHEKSAHAHLLENPKLPKQLIGFEFPVPTSKRFAAICRRGILPLVPWQRCSGCRSVHEFGCCQLVGWGSGDHDVFVYQIECRIAVRFAPFFSTILPELDGRHRQGLGRIVLKFGAIITEMSGPLA